MGRLSSIIILVMLLASIEIAAAQYVGYEKKGYLLIQQDRYSAGSYAPYNYYTRYGYIAGSFAPMHSQEDCYPFVLENPKIRTHRIYIPNPVCNFNNSIPAKQGIDCSPYSRHLKSRASSGNARDPLCYDRVNSLENTPVATRAMPLQTSSAKLYFGTDCKPITRKEGQRIIIEANCYPAPRIRNPGIGTRMR